METCRGSSSRGACPPLLNLPIEEWKRGSDELRELDRQHLLNLPIEEWKLGSHAPEERQHPPS